MKIFQVVICFFLVCNHSYTQKAGIINNEKSPYTKLKSIDLADCRWTNGFWADKTEQCRQVMLPNLGDLMNDPEIIHAYDNFLIAAGLKKGEFRSWSFTDGDFYKYVEALAFAYTMTKDEKINQNMDEIIAVIAKAQRPDGYIHTQIQIGHGINAYRHSMERKFTKKNGPFERAEDHEFYNFGHLMTAACIHYRATGKTNFLDIAKKASDMLYTKFLHPTPELAKVDWNPPHYMGLTEMYRTTGDKRYLELAEAFINMRGTGIDRDAASQQTDQSLKRVPIRQLTEASGHAGFANYLYAGVSDVYAENGDKTLLAAMERVWNSLVTKQMYLTGGTGPHHFAISPNREKVSESYGKAYELPNIGAYNETCANIGNAMWSYRMLLITGEAKYADVMERVFYNSAISCIALDGKHFFYTNPLRHIHEHPLSTKDNGIRSSFISVFCCPPNIIRTITSMNGYAYNTSEKGIWVNLYGGNELNTKLGDGSSLKLTQQTDYPWDGLVKITVDIPVKKAFSVMLRIPSWENQAKLKVNGQVVSGTLTPGSYFELRRIWAKGDVIEFDMPMSPQLIEANPMVEDNRNQVAVQRGPIVYCMESVDLPKDVNISQVQIPRNIQLHPRFDKNLLSGVTVLEGEAKCEKGAVWSNQLYRPLSTEMHRKLSIKLIPYYAWSNRGASDMTVWLPELRE